MATRRHAKVIEHFAVPCDAAKPEALRVELAQLACYERNPRRSRNPEYDRIKASIASSGLDQPLLITRRPGDTNFIVQAGGNTRLQVLNELYASTGDERFNRIDCLHVEWQCESAVLLAHLRENDLRGDLTFIDRARALFEVKTLLAEERQVGDISHRQFETLLKDRGYGVSHVIISIMDYTLAVLLPAMPIALAAGLGRPQVQRIRSLHRVGSDVWQLRGIGEDREFQEIFQGLCRCYDCIDWQFAPLRQAVEVELAEAADVSIQIMRVEFDCRLSGREPDIPDFVQQDNAVDFEYPSMSSDGSEMVAEPPMQATFESGALPMAAVPRGTTGDRSGHHAQPIDVAENTLQVVVELPPKAIPGHGHESADEATRAPISIEELRERICALAQRFADRHGLGNLIAPLRDTGLGYLVRSIPSPSQLAPPDDHQRARISTLWWQLVAFAELPSAPTDVLDGQVGSQAELYVAVTTGDWSSLTRSVPMPDLAYLGLQFWRHLDDADWQDWLSLAAGYREMHRLAATENRSLWEQTP